MITNDFLQGYIQALDNIDSALINFINVAKSTNPRNKCPINSYENVRTYIEQIKINYKKLVKELNETQSKKTT
jgi:hypothetical protein